MFADIASGHVDAADIIFLVAMIVFVVAAWVRWTERSIAATLEALGFAAVALALLLL